MLEGLNILWVPTQHEQREGVLSAFRCFHTTSLLCALVFEILCPGPHLVQKQRPRCWRKRLQSPVAGLLPFQFRRSHVLVPRGWIDAPPAQQASCIAHCHS